MRRWILLLAVAAVLTAGAGGARAATFSPGSPGLGDPFFPLAGNGGYDVRDYALTLDYDPSANLLQASATISARATQNLSRFDLDLRGFAISRLTVDGKPASWTRDGQELVISPQSGIPAGRAFGVVVDYAGTPSVITDPDGSVEGWVPTPDGAFVVNEPQGSPSWYPVNDTPKDKATYDFAITVPAGNVAIGNGILLSSVTDGGKTTWRWREDSPMASYLTTATNGDFTLTVDTGPNGLPIYNAIDSEGDSAATNGFSAAQKATAAQRFAASRRSSRCSPTCGARTRSRAPAR
jgi:aminopeptidase N